MNMEALNEFLALSLVLTGENTLDVTLAREYFVRLQRVYLDDLNILIAAFDGLSSSGASQLCE
jgi:hypothetical protein